MKKFLVGAAVGLVALVGVAPAAAAAEGNAYGYTVQSCVGVSVGDAIKAGKAAHPGVSMTAKSIAMSPHCMV